MIEGPSSRTTLVGPDGSVISSVQPGARIIADPHATVLEHAAPVTAYSAPTGHVVAHEHIVAPVLQTRTAVLAPATKTIVSESAHTLVAQDAPVVANTVEIAPVVAKTVELAPIVAEKHVAIEAAPVVATVGAKTSISEHSTSIVHPSPAVAVHAEPVVATRVATPVVTAEHIAVAPIVGTKTTISEHGQAVVSHSAPAIHTLHAAPVVHHVAHDAVVGDGASAVVADGAPAIVAHVGPAVAVETHVSPFAAIGAKTVVSEHAQSVVSHPLHHVHSVPLARLW